MHRLKSSFVPTDNQVYISTIKRLYALLKNEDLDETAEELGRPIPSPRGKLMYA